MTNFWENPELIRHVRMELRPRRVTIASTVSVAICLMIWMSMSQIKDSANGKGYLEGLYVTLVIGQAAVLFLWSFSACSQAIANERAMRTFDFLRTTRLTSGELVAGMLFGVPVMSYFVVTLTYGISLLAGLMAGYSLVAILATYLATLMIGIVLSLIGLTLSMLMEKPRAGGALAILLLWPFTWSLAFASKSAFPALTALAVFPGLFKLYGNPDPEFSSRVLFFGEHLPTLLVSVILYSTIAMWLLVMLRRNLKREREDIKLLSRWQGIGFAVYVNVMIFGMLDTQRLVSPSISSYTGILVASPDPADVVPAVNAGFLLLNFFIFYAVGLTTLSTPERLKHWWRERSDVASYFSDDGPSWPWITLVAVIALALYAVESFMTPGIPSGKWDWPAWQVWVLLMYAIRDVMFVQWCTLTKMKDAVGKAMAFILLYYFMVFSVLAVFHSDSKAWLKGLAVLTPYGAFDASVRVPALLGSFLQVGLVVMLALMIQQRFARKAA